MNFYCGKAPIVLDSLLGLKEIKLKNGWHLYIDQGWQVTDDYAFKGIDSNWCKLDFSKNLKVTTNAYRHFPLYYHDLSVTNLIDSTDLLSADGMVEWTNDKANVKYQKDFYIDETKNKLDFTSSSKLLLDHLTDTIEKFATENNKTILIPAQNGLDTLTVRSVFDKLKIKYDFFTMQNKPILSKVGKSLRDDHWGFNQIDEVDNAVIVTGFYGDEWVLRNPYYVNAILKHRNKNVTDIFDSIDKCYMKKFFENYRKKCAKQKDYSFREVQEQICNDFQIWHLNKTYFFSPLKGKLLLNLLNADTETIIQQVTDAKLSKSVIEKCNPKLLSDLDDLKNQNDPYWFD